MTPLIAALLLIPTTPAVHSPTLAAEAAVWAHHLADTATLAHDPKLNRTPRSDWQALGENVGRGPSVATVLAGFDASPLHSAVANDPRWDRVGMAVVVKGTTYYVCIRFQETRTK